MKRRIEIHGKEEDKKTHDEGENPQIWWKLRSTRRERGKPKSSEEEDDERRGGRWWRRCYLGKMMEIRERKRKPHEEWLFGKKEITCKKRIKIIEKWKVRNYLYGFPSTVVGQGWGALLLMTFTNSELWGVFSHHLFPKFAAKQRLFNSILLIPQLKGVQNQFKWFDVVLFNSIIIFSPFTFPKFLNSKLTTNGSYGFFFFS